jgi:hypothetical protein
LFCFVFGFVLLSIGATLDRAESWHTVLRLQKVTASSDGSHDRQECNNSTTSYRAR